VLLPPKHVSNLDARSRKPLHNSLRLAAIPTDNDADQLYWCSGSWLMKKNGRPKQMLLYLAALLLFGCAAQHDIQPAFVSGDSGINGRLVTTRSSGGEVQVTGTTRGTVKVTTADETQQVATVDTDSNGNFAIGLRPGRYFVYTELFDGMFYGRRVSVEPGQMTPVEIRLPPE
jgi:hypothetical protein